ncbi:vinorine synthase-like, partial [Chenopodium quinoa]|uniref:vinorine synthase-like n=1 Tax=Chenopodium quinoa TaxID=63459 RepID=UPI000B77EC5C
TSSDDNINILTLSKTLSFYYPLAGRLANDKFTVDCNDSGIIFVEAQANITLEDFLQAPNRVETVSQSLPSINALELVPLAIQMSTFDCGGFTATSLFPPCSWATPRCSKPLTARPLSGGDHEEDDSGCAARALIFTPKAITELQDIARSELVPVPTWIEALSGFIWKHEMTAATAAAAAKSEVEVSGSSVLIHTVNMRPRINPPIPPTSHRKSDHSCHCILPVS